MAHNCNGCGCVINSGGVRTTEEVESGRSTGVSRTGKFNFDVTKKRYSERKHFKKVTVYYCDSCWGSKQRTQRYSIIFGILVVLGFIGYFYFTPSSTSDRSKSSSKTSVVSVSEDALPRIEVLMNQADENGEKLDSGFKEAVSTDGASSEVLIAAVAQCYQIYENLKRVKSDNEYAVKAANSFAHAVFVRCGYFNQAKTIVTDLPRESRGEALESLNKDVSKASQGVKNYMSEGAEYYNKAKSSN